MTAHSTAPRWNVPLLAEISDRHHYLGCPSPRPPVRHDPVGLSATYPFQPAVQQWIEGGGKSVRPTCHRPQSNARPFWLSPHDYCQQVRDKATLRGFLRRCRFVEEHLSEEGTRRSGRIVQLPARGGRGRVHERFLHSHARLFCEGEKKVDDSLAFLKEQSRV